VKPEERQRQILAQLYALQSEVSAVQLAGKFDVAQLTIRRDLEELEKEKIILRTHGGCVLRTAVESAYRKRVVLNFELKQAIGRGAAKEVENGDVILINDGSTPFHPAPQLGHVEELFVYTNSLSVLTRFPGTRTFVLGGEHNFEMHFIGGSMTQQA
jgi:DeoR/GlpR family transcriptional regulator of sugar metabolism